MIKYGPWFTAPLWSLLPRLNRPSRDQTPFSHTTSSFVNSSEQRKYFDAVLQEELGPIYTGVPGFYETYFGGIKDLGQVGAAVFRNKKAAILCLQKVDGWNGLILQKKTMS